MLSQIERVSLEDLVPEHHSDCQFFKLWKFGYARKCLEKLAKDIPIKAMGCLLYCDELP